MDHLRHCELFDASRLSATLVGCGGIGAATALALGKMGVGYLELWDDDTVDDVNLATQLHRLSDVGNSKVHAVSQLVSEFSDDTNTVGFSVRIGSGDLIHNQIVISAVDSIQARKGIWNAVKNGKVHWYLDSRMAAEQFRLYVVDMESDWSWYDNMLAQEDDSTALAEACTSKATIYTAFIAAGMIGSAVKAISISEPQPKIQMFNIRALNLTVIE